jgi:hypothetical protein
MKTQRPNSARTKSKFALGASLAKQSSAASPESWHLARELQGLGSTAEFCLAGVFCKFLFSEFFCSFLGFGNKSWDKV